MWRVLATLGYASNKNTAHYRNGASLSKIVIIVIGMI